MGLDDMYYTDRKQKRTWKDFVTIMKRIGLGFLVALIGAGILDLINYLS